MSQGDNNIFIDGKNQVIELLRYMNKDEREKLLRGIKLRNAAMAKELNEQSFSFNDIEILNDTNLEIIFNNMSPIVVGLALYNCHKKIQRRILSLMHRPKAEEAYKILMKDLSSHGNECLKARNKVVETVVMLSKRRLINI